MNSGYIRIDTVNSFNKQVVFMFNIQPHLTYLTRLAYKIISYFDIIAQLMVVFIYLLLYL